MAENVLQSLQQFIQDVLAPDVRELKVRVSSLEQRMDTRFDAMDTRFEAMDTRFEAMELQIKAQFKLILAEIRESKTSTENTVLREIGDLRERIAVLEAQRR